MLGFFKWFTRAQKPHEKGLNEGKSRLYVPGNKIKHDPHLIPRLVADHHNLIIIFEELIKDCQRGNFTRSVPMLKRFLSMFNDHLLLEYSKLYVYLDYALRHDREYHDLIMEFRSEMNQIGKVVRLFCKHWIRDGIVVNHRARYVLEVNQIGNALLRRIATEEDRLYHIYDMAPQLKRNP